TLSEVQDRAFRPAASRGQLEGVRDVNDFLDAGRGAQGLEFAAMLIAIAHDSDHGSLLPANQVRLKAALLDAGHYVADLAFGCITQHIDDHFFVSSLRRCRCFYDVAPAVRCAERYEPRMQSSTANFSSSAIAARASGSRSEACKSK